MPASERELSFELMLLALQNLPAGRRSGTILRWPLRRAILRGLRPTRWRLLLRSLAC